MRYNREYVDVTDKRIRQTKGMNECKLACYLTASGHYPPIRQSQNSTVQNFHLYLLFVYPIALSAGSQNIFFHAQDFEPRPSHVFVMRTTSQTLSPRGIVGKLSWLPLDSPRKSCVAS